MSEEPIEPVSAAKVAYAFAETLVKAGAHPAHVFAVRQCGFVLTEANMDTFSEDDIAEWEDALDRWFEMLPEANWCAPSTLARSHVVTGAARKKLADSTRSIRRSGPVLGDESLPDPTGRVPLLTHCSASFSTSNNEIRTDASAVHLAES